jgi:hypothetical protein
MSKEAMKLALEALEDAHHTVEHKQDAIGRIKAITALREALAEQPAQQEPVAYLCENAVGHKYFRWKKPSSEYKPIALYTSPPAQRTWVDLTPQNLNEIFKVANTGEGAVHLALKLIKEKNT